MTSNNHSKDHEPPSRREVTAEELARFLYDAAGFHAADSWDTETLIVRGHYEAPAAAILARFHVTRRDTGGQG